MKKIIRLLVLDDNPLNAKRRIQESISRISVDSTSASGPPWFIEVSGDERMEIEAEFWEDPEKIHSEIANGQVTASFDGILIDNDWKEADPQMLFRLGLIDGDGAADAVGLKFLKLLSDSGPSFPLAAMFSESPQFDSKYISEALRGGARAFIFKSEGVHLLNFLCSVSDSIQYTDISVAAHREMERVDVRLKSSSVTMQKSLHNAARFALGTMPILIQGPTGCGKELLAKAIHKVSTRSDQPFVAKDCATISESLAESTLFGHEAGSFTGATGQQTGLFERAKGGTLFLDEIDKLNLGVQQALLRALAEDGEFERVGGRHPIRTDLRLISASSADLELKVEKGEFSRDLYSRLAAAIVRLPPLNNRREDIEVLSTGFAAESGRSFGRNVELEVSAIDVLKRHDWPYNIRELKQTIERTVALLGAGQSKISADDIDFEGRGSHSTLQPSEAASEDYRLISLRNNAPRRGSTQRTIFDILFDKYSKGVPTRELRQAIGGSDLADSGDVSGQLATAISRLNKRFEDRKLEFQINVDRSSNTYTLDRSWH